MAKIKFSVNGKTVQMDTDPLKRLIDILREDLDLVSVKEGCGEGECGSCSILMDGQMVNSCLVPVLSADGTSIVTMEGLSQSDRGKCIIEAFAGEGSVQCGYCTPGMVMAAESILTRHPNPSEQEIRIGLSGNLCRCTGYDMIVKGIQTAAKNGDGLW